jgi:carboxyl-terminal processing protease
LKTALRILLAVVILFVGIAIGANLKFFSEALPAMRSPGPTSFTETPNSAIAVPSTGTPTPAGVEEIKKSFGIVWEAWRVLADNFYGTLPTPREAAYDAIRGIVQGLGDPFTNFFTPEQAKQFDEDMSGKFEGIGALVKQADGGGILIVETFENSPARKSGLQKGDVIIAVDGKDVTKMSLQEAIMLVRGPAGTTVTLTIKRQGKEEPFDVKVTRAKINIPVVKKEMRPDGIAYLKLTSFTSNSPKLVHEALKELLAKHPKGLIFDLRGNGGGYLGAAVDIGSEFLSEGDILVEKTRDGKENHYRVKKDGIARDIPLVVLVDGGTASASEIVAGAIQDDKRGVLIGEKTFGKGSVQIIKKLSDGSELKVTIAHWFTPKGRAIHGKGIEPDIKVKLTAEDQKAGKDPQLDRAVQYLLTGK